MLPSICRTSLCVSILNWRVLVSLLYSRLGCFLIFTTAGIKCVVRERHMRPAGQIGSHALSLNQSTTSGFVFLVLCFVFVSLSLKQSTTTHFVLFCVSLMPVSQSIHQSTSGFVFLVFVFVSTLSPESQSIHHLQLCLFLYLDFNTCLSLNHPPIFIIDVRQKKNLRGAGIMNFKVEIKAQGWPNYAGTF